MSILNHLSEPHNFGKRVIERPDGWISKPRSVFWEKLFLSQSSFRMAVEEFFVRTDRFNPFTNIPTLNFGPSDNEYSEVEKLIIEPIYHITRTEAQSLGAACATFAWFGVTDLNSENVFIGRRNSVFTFAPIDIECIGSDLAMLSETLLVPNYYIPDRKSGLMSILEVLRNDSDRLLAPICHGYLDAIHTFLENEAFFDEVFINAIGGVRPPIRVLLRKTASYANFMNGCAKPKEFIKQPLASELEQMSRGDIPYYFRYPERKTIYHYTTPDCITPSDANDNFDDWGEIIGRARALIHPIEQREKKDFLAPSGALQLCRALLAKENARHSLSTYKHCKIECNGVDIFLEYKDKIKIRCPLNSPSEET